MRVLYFTWYENCKDDALEAFANMGIEVTLVDGQIRDYFHDQLLEQRLINQIEQKSYDFLFSFNYFPFLTNVAEQQQIPYVSWIYDCPHNTLYAKNVESEWNYIFSFDQVQCQKLKQSGLKHVFHLPLAVNTRRLDLQLGVQTGAYRSQVSFVGSLYENSLYDQIQYLPEYLKGFLDAIFASQRNIWGYDFFSELLTDERVQMLAEYIKLPMDDNYHFSEKQIFVDILNAKMTSLDRIESLQLLGEVFPVDLYTNSQFVFGNRVKNRGTVTYMQEMPEVFRTSRINLNITLRSITSGIPLRALDIMGAGGFLLSNYQPELMEYFVPGEEMVMYNSREELVDLCAYYLEHDGEREEICKNGQQKVRKLFSYEKQLQKIVDILGEMG